MTYATPAPIVGAKYAGYRDAADVARMVRADVKSARSAGRIPADVKISVRIDRYSMGQSVDVRLSGWTYGRVWSDGVDAYGPARTMTPAARHVLDIIERIRDAYNRDASDSMTDYFDVMYAGVTQWDVTR